MRGAKLKIIFALIFSLAILSPTTEAALPTKMKALLTTSAYGTVGGALLGLASMAFGTKPIAVAQGASIGLWAGLAFGSYIVLSHHYDLNRSKYVSPGEDDEESPIYPSGKSPYDEEGAVEVDTYGSPQLKEMGAFEQYSLKLGQKQISHPWGIRTQERRGQVNLFELSF